MGYYDHCELTSIELDAEIARLDGITKEGFSPSTNWSEGGQIIEREKIELLYYGTKGYKNYPWEAQIGQNIHYIDQGPGDAAGGPTALIAAMRAYVGASMRYELKTK